jgi:hypothetical protein
MNYRKEYQDKTDTYYRDTAQKESFSDAYVVWLEKKLEKTETRLTKKVMEIEELKEEMDE